MYEFAYLYKRSINCSNIIQRIIKIKKLKEINKLALLILTNDIVSTIPKTIIFIDTLGEKVILANYLYNLLSAYIKKDQERLI